jgi:hypothetical protein
VEYRESIKGRLQGERKEIWPFVLGFLLIVLAVEMGVANTNVTKITYGKK